MNFVRLLTPNRCFLKHDSHHFPETVEERSRSRYPTLIHLLYISRQTLDMTLCVRIGESARTRTQKLQKLQNIMERFDRTNTRTKFSW